MDVKTIEEVADELIDILSFLGRELVQGFLSIVNNCDISGLRGIYMFFGKEETEFINEVGADVESTYVKWEDVVALTSGKDVESIAAGDACTDLCHEVWHYCQVLKEGDKEAYDDKYVRYVQEHGYENNPYEVEAESLASICPELPECVPYTLTYLAIKYLAEAWKAAQKGEDTTEYIEAAEEALNELRKALTEANLNELADTVGEVINKLK